MTSMHPVKLILFRKTMSTAQKLNLSGWLLIRFVLWCLLGKGSFLYSNTMHGAVKRVSMSTRGSMSTEPVWIQKCGEKSLLGIELQLSIGVYNLFWLMWGRTENIIYLVSNGSNKFPMQFLLDRQIISNDYKSACGGPYPCLEWLTHPHTGYFRRFI
jgi:hypothetical protein